MLARNLPRDSATVRSVLGDAAAWNTTEQLLATVVDLLALANWQRGGGKANRRPEPLQRPGTADGNRIGTPIPLEEMKRMAADWRAGRLKGRPRELVKVR